MSEGRDSPAERIHWESSLGQVHRGVRRRTSTEDTYSWILWSSNMSVSSRCFPSP